MKQHKTRYKVIRRSVTIDRSDLFALFRMPNCGSVSEAPANARVEFFGGGHGHDFNEEAKIVVVWDEWLEMEAPDET